MDLTNNDNNMLSFTSNAWDHRRVPSHKEITELHLVCGMGDDQILPNPAPNAHYTQSVLRMHNLYQQIQEIILWILFLKWMLGMEKIINEYPHETYFWQCIPSGASSMN
jgi:hypothetical protein